jgi:hypothetical protein
VKIPKGLIEEGQTIQQYNSPKIMSKGQAMIHKTLQRKLKI